ncbi:MAG: hypothetical protein IKY19_00360 [Bacteroidaceae bacterium]|nr:hypothetical protein [Bacteroidaceae bacterium]
MNKENVIKSLRFNFATSVFAALIAIAAFETGYLTKGVLALSLSEEDLYYIEVCTIILTIGIIPFAIKGFSRAMKKASNIDNIAFLKLYSKKSLQCMFLLFISLVINIFVYYGIDYDGAMYCAILSFGALLYSYPTGKIFDEYNNNSNKTK